MPLLARARFRALRLSLLPGAFMRPDASLSADALWRPVTAPTMAAAAPSRIGKRARKKIILVIFFLILYCELGNYFLEKHLARLLFEAVIFQRPAHAEQTSLLIREFLALKAESLAPPSIALLGEAPHLARLPSAPPSP